MIIANNAHSPSAATFTHNLFQNAEIEQRLAAAAEDSQLNHKVLLLGAGETGKSTIVKQFKLLYSVCVLTLGLFEPQQPLLGGCNQIRIFKSLNSVLLFFL